MTAIRARRRGAPKAQKITAKHLAMIQSGGTATIFRWQRKEQWIWDFNGLGDDKSFKLLWCRVLIQCKWDTVAGTAYAYASDRGQKLLLENGIQLYYNQGVRHDITA